MSKKKEQAMQAAVYDARKLGKAKMGVLGLQHMFAMFGATVLVPILTGLSVSTTLLFAGVGTLLFHLLTRGKVPAFLGSSFAFLAGYFAIAPGGDPSLLPYACLGVACAGCLYLILSALFAGFGAKRVMRFFPPVVTGPIVICIGLILCSSAVTNCQVNWLVAVIAVIIIVLCNIWGKGMIKILPILLGVAITYIICLLLTMGADITPIANGDGTFTDFYCLGGKEGLQLFSVGALQGIKDAAWIGIPFTWDQTVFSIFGSGFDSGLAITAIITIVPLALATMIEHIGDISAISSTCGRNFIAHPGLHRTLLGDGLATILASLFGAPANTTYGENTGVLALTRVFDPRVIRIAACFAILLSFCPKFAAVITAMPTAVVGGISLVLYGMISAVGVRNLIENHVDFTKSRNIIVAALILTLSLGINYTGAIAFACGNITISLSGLAVGSIVGIILNAIFPGKDYDFDDSVEMGWVHEAEQAEAAAEAAEQAVEAGVESAVGAAAEVAEEAEEVIADSAPDKPVS
ncbi:MAG: uracil-xanthine permease [Coriobacteriales bacterium]|nr:uracil-xanthine permease [Coriobacteriales bacterium]